MKVRKKIAVVAAHPDDEVLGCGATLLKHAALGDEISLLFMTTGIASRTAQRKQVKQRNAGFQKAIEYLCPHYWQQLDWSDNAMDQDPLLAIVKSVEKFFIKVQPEIVYTHWIHDLNIDHAVTAKAVCTAARALPEQSIRILRSFEISSSSEWSPTAAFHPNYFSDVSNLVAKKEAYLECYEQEMRDFPHARSFEAIKALMTYRGASVGVAAAEAFLTIREIA